MQRRTVDVPTPQVLEETVEVVSLAHEGAQQRTAKQIEDVPQFSEDTVEVDEVCVEMVSLVFPQERVQWIGEQMVEVPIPQIAQEIV